MEAGYVALIILVIISTIIILKNMNNKK